MTAGLTYILPHTGTIIQYLKHGIGSNFIGINTPYWVIETIHFHLVVIIYLLKSTNDGGVLL